MRKNQGKPSPADPEFWIERLDTPLGWVKRGVLLGLLLSAAACQRQIEPERTAKQGTANPDKLEARLTLNNAILERSDDRGQKLWKIGVKRAVYSKDKKIAQLEKLAGEVFQDGKVVLRISGDGGEVHRDGEEIFLKDIRATDPRNGAIVQGKQVEWRPKEGILMLRDHVTGRHTKLEASAREGKYYTRKQQLELIGDIVATAKDPRLQLKTQHLVWEISQQKVVGDKPLQLVRYKDKTITDRVVADRAEVDLKTDTAKLQQDIDFKSLAPPVQIAADSVTWNYKTRTVESDRPVQLVHYQDRIAISGNQGSVDLDRQVAHLKGGVQGQNAHNPAKLYADEMIWKIPTQIVEAMGNVIYEQANPKISLTGTKAVGTLKDNKIIVSGDRGNRVVTEIIPQ